MSRSELHDLGRLSLCNTRPSQWGGGQRQIEGRCADCTEVVLVSTFPPTLPQGQVAIERLAFLHDHDLDTVEFTSEIHDHTLLGAFKKHTAYHTTTRPGALSLTSESSPGCSFVAGVSIAYWVNVTDPVPTHNINVYNQPRKVLDWARAGFSFDDLFLAIG
ncbi:hypothetical protein CROQUDRAFT_91099 [Cronartium quercuum f. sp. fusiforme G11]|uniref:Uncharacterized protein n=1 Tax=Cronartium quercuum f. sp. fusiforme G11 TaxID=708437 RepID=A0A9P6NKR6_9BASI|nr:hypothetical protein CROQUDRAFT_91099 [Cronartium quercuum f. sp. fusiforme G11]